MAKKKTLRRTSPKQSSVKAPSVAQFVLNCIPSQETERDWSFGDAASAGVLAAAAIPASKDLREPSWWSIGHQGSTGSCVGWATADSVLRWHLVKANRLSKSQQLSMRYVWMASKETDVFITRPTTFIESEGTSLKAALDICRNFGVVLDSVLPFASGVLYPGSTNSFYAQAARRKIASYFNLGRNPTNWRTWIANNGPILTRLDVDATWDAAASTGGKLDTYQPLTARGGHAVAIVGYTQERFIIRNSWGTTWGDKGFGYASNAYAADAFTEAYGVSL
jgi:C1A family cysteine protease